MSTWYTLGTALPVVVRYGYVTRYNTERLTSVFNFGLGDLDISDLRLGSTPLASYTEVQQDDSIVPEGQGDRTELRGYTAPAWPGDLYPGAVQILDGARLEQRDGVAGGGWVERSASRACRYVQIDVAGRLFKQAGGGFEELSVELAMEYQRPGESTWTAFAFSPVTARNASATPLRKTWSVMTDGVQKIRVRRITPESTDASLIAELELVRVKFFADSDALYPAQRRLGVLIRATGQLNGRIERLSGFVRPRLWVWTGGPVWDGSLPGQSANWQWGFSTNPAWVFIYYARGGYLDPASARGWSDQPTATSTTRLFGAGLKNARIDYAALVTWGVWCDAQPLQCRMAEASQRPAKAVLDDIAAAGHGMTTWASGRLGVWYEAADAPVVAAFGMANIVAGTFSIAYSSDDTVDEFALEYTRSDDDYNADTVYAVVPGVASPASQRTEKAAYAMPRAQAQRIVNLLAAGRFFHRRTITWETELEGLAVARGDVVHLGHDLTEWASSGRLLGIELEAGRVRWLTLSRTLDSGAGEFWFWLRRPDGSFLRLRRAATGAAESSRFELLDRWDASDAPGELDEQGTPNPASVWPDTTPLDWMFLAGPTATPGKRVRLLSVEPTSDRRVRMTARDDVSTYYALQYGLGNPALPDSGEATVASAFNAGLHRQDDGGYLLTWELTGAWGATVTLLVNGQDQSTSGALSVLGTSLLLPAYAPGTRLVIQIIPISAGQAKTARIANLEVTVN